MGCEVRTLENGTTMIVCSRGRWPKPKCIACGKPADFLCDYPVGDKTCDAPLCGKCRVNVGVVDYCPTHPPVKVQA